MVERNERRATPAQMDRQHIFVVNSSPDFLDIVRELLQEEQYNVTTTNFVPRTFDQIQALQPSLLIIDVAITQPVGWDLLARLRAGVATDCIPLIVVSTDPRLLAEARANEAVWGADRFLLKPFDIADLLTMVNELIGPA